MKFFVAFALIVAVASAGFIKPINNDEAQIQLIVDAINSPHTDPATAILLQQQLAQLLGIAPPSPVIVDVVDPVIVVDEAAVSPVVVVDDAVSPVIVVDEAAVSPVVVVDDAVSPVIVVDEAAPVAPVINPNPVVNPTPARSPLVQIILNINAPPGSVDVTDDSVDGVLVVDEAHNHVDIDPPGDGEIMPIIIQPIVVDPPTAPVFEPIIVGELPLFPAPAVTVPETLN